MGNQACLKVLLLAEHPEDARFIRELLAGNGAVSFDVEWYRRPSDFPGPPRTGKADAILLDWSAPGLQDWNILSQIRDEFPGAAVVILDEEADEEAAWKAIQSGVQEWISRRELDRRHLIRALRFAVERKRLEGKAAGEPASRKPSEEAAPGGGTREAQIQQYLRRMQKWQVLGKLAGGLSHGFNSLLSTIMINTEMALFDLEKSTARRCLPLVLHAAEEGRNIVTQIISFSRLKEQPRRPMNMSPVVKASLKFLRYSLPKNIEIREDLVTLSDVVNGDASQIHQILVNLCVNASDSMRGEGGLLEVKLSVVDTDPFILAVNPGLRPGSYVRLTVKDTGEGIPREVVDRIFDPFFTTRNSGEGSGMGLAVVDALVKSYGGSIEVYSEVGQGTTFKLYLPRVQDEPEQEAILREATAGQKQRILLVDDEEIQLFSMQSMLRRLGYRVKAHRSSEEALSVFEIDPNGFDLVITDQTMPKMTGIKLAEALLSLRPDIPIILCTGYSEAVNRDEAKSVGVREFMMKPFSTTEMAEAIREVLKE